IVVNPAVVRAFPRESWPASEAPSQSADEPEYDPSHADSGPEFAAWAKITREGTSTSIKVSMYRLPRNKTYYLYVIDPSGTPVQIFKLNRSGYETSTWNRSTEPGTFMLALSMSDRLTDIETDKNVFMTSETPDGFSIVPKNP
ncbi:MAG TPA: hypothetical protein VJS64_10515, partial [Pyrinomonadaceae bacterium]|nr:hypothetical protein [Pyrinomonadaceae bacterium]